VATTTHRLTAADELWLLPDHGGRCELIRGEVVERFPTHFEHFSLVGLLTRLLGNHAAERGLRVVGGEGGFRLERDPDTVLAPDVAFVRTDRLPPREQWRHGFPDLAPDLAIEILSPSESAAEINDKLFTYLDAGVRQVWIVDPGRRAVSVATPEGMVRILRAGDSLDGGDILPGFTVPIAELFAE
jgi:Uma2 family endonuclease